MLTLIAKSGKAALQGDARAETAIWGYNGMSPGPILRVRQGGELSVRIVNELTQPTSLHWHGLRIVNAMDGVPGLTQEAVAPGQHFDYHFKCPDAGTFWYHPHILSSEQVARGLNGILIVDEPEPPAVDQDLVFAIDDWRLDHDGQIHAASFGSVMERAHGGRHGNTFTLNGRVNRSIPVEAGERLRIRLCNISNANVFGIKIDNHVMRVIAIDGQPVDPFEPDEGYVVLATAQRADVIVDASAKPGKRSSIRLVTYDGEQTLGELVYHETERRREMPMATPVVLPANPLDTKLDLAQARSVSLVMDGGAMGRMDGAWFDNEWLGMRELIDRHGVVWAFNANAGMPAEPLFRVSKGTTVKLSMANRTSWPHAMHLHGHHFKQIARKPDGPREPYWRDTILLNPDDAFTMAFVADNPGKWMLHCHMLEHQEGGMMTWFKVTA
jgi:FtsP/CotA-like multicopper oxidase with cupredoxin domain